MKALIQRLLAPVLIAVILAALLSTVPTLSDQWGTPQVVDVFQPNTFKRLTTERVADYLLSQSLQVRVIRVEWNQPTFFVELIQPPSMSEATMAKEMYQLIRTSLVQTDNIKDVRLVIHQDAQASWLIIAKRDQLKNDPEMLNKAKLPYKEYLDQTFHLKILPSQDVNR